MGADTFTSRASGATVSDAFNNAVRQAQYDHGHSGYTGTVAEKSSCVVITPVEGVAPKAYAGALMNYDDTRPLPEWAETHRAKFLKDVAAVDDKWGPAGAIKDGETWLFFGWASS